MSSPTAITLYEFQSTPSVGRATIAFNCKPYRNLTFQSTPSVGRATGGEYEFDNYTIISIHALRGEGDGKESTISDKCKISIHALRGEGDN